MDYNMLLRFLTLLKVIPYNFGWQYFTSMTDIDMSNSMPTHQIPHSEYFYGECDRKDIIFYEYVHLDHLQVLGKIIIRGWIDIPRIPICIKVRAMAFEEDTFRSTAFKFQICVPRITYCHSQRRYKYFYYEWYIPPNMVGGMNWDILFYGPQGLEWG